MAGLTNTSYNSPRLTTGFLNTQNDPQPGVLQVAQSGYITGTYGGMVGANYIIDADDAFKVSSLSVGQLYGGTYKYVKTSLTGMTNPGVGRLVFWDTSVAEDAYQVTQLETSNGSVPLLAGVLISIPTPGNYCWIQIAGRATTLCRAAVTNASRYIIWAAAGAGADNATVDGALATATVTQAVNYQVLGIAESVAANSTLIITNIRPALVARQ